MDTILLIGILATLIFILVEIRRFKKLFELVFIITKHKKKKIS